MKKEIFFLLVNFLLISSVIVEAFPKSQGFQGKFLSDYMKEGYGQPVVAYEVPQSVEKKNFSGAGMYKVKRLNSVQKPFMWALKKREDPNSEGYLVAQNSEFY